MKKNILIIGSGMFGMAMSQILIENGHNVYIKTKNVDAINKIMSGKHEGYKNFKLLPPKNCFLNYEDSFNQNIDIVLLCIPSIAVNSTIEEIKPFLRENTIIVNTAKGINPINNTMWSKNFIINGIQLPYALLVGPSFATEIIKKEKTIVNIVSNDDNLNKLLQNIFNNNYFKLIPFNDEYTASLVSSFKNALAVGLGLLNYYTKSFNTLSAFLVIGIEEIQLLISKITNNSQVRILDFFGVGDIYLTCNSDESRNFQFGLSIAENNGIFNIEFDFSNKTVEGYRTIELINSFINKYQLQCPMFKSLYEICYKNKSPNRFIDEVWKKFN
ncbi:MAG: NAD(P)-binding domain-containing protein [Ureaplasma sp.]|nr:NAD(P)-binding domain-containing protein [Ureaplasma sp.]